MVKGIAAVNLRVLLVEDGEIVSIIIEDDLSELGCRVVGPTKSVVASLALLYIDQVDIALVNLTLRGELALPVAEALIGEAIPFAFITGHSSKIVRATRYADVPLLPKPFSKRAFTNLVRQLGDSIAPPVSESSRVRQWRVH
jgi:two-component SAPR family response regulator